MSSNLIGGFHNRLEGSRKYLFGVANVYGTANNSVIEGAYIIRGSDFKGVFDVAPDWESYEFSPLDIKADKDYILGVWSGENKVEGKEYADGKVRLVLFFALLNVYPLADFNHNGQAFK